MAGTPSDFGGDFGAPDFSTGVTPPAVAGAVRVLIPNPFVYYPQRIARAAADTKPPVPRYLVNLGR